MKTCRGCGGQFDNIEEHLVSDATCAAARNFQKKIAPSQLRFPSEGVSSKYRCPQCGSDDIYCDMVWMEFSSMRCGACGHKQLADEYQITDWFPD